MSAWLPSKLQVIPGKSARNWGSTIYCYGEGVYVFKRQPRCAIIDVYSRYVVAWGLSNSLDAQASLEVLRKGIDKHGSPEIVNSDQGAQFTCCEWVNHLKGEGIQISMDGKGRALDNIYIERLWRTVKRDYVYLHPAQDGWELSQGLTGFFDFYNHEKHHQGIGRQVPYQVYQN